MFAAALACGLYCYLGGVFFFFLFIACPRQHCEFFATLERLSARSTRPIPEDGGGVLPRSRSSRAGTVFVSRTRPRTWMSRRSYQWLLALASQARFRSASRARVDAALVACWSLL